MADNIYMSIMNFLKDSPTKYLRFDMQNFRGDVINTQIIRASDLTYVEDKVYAKYKITPELSAMMVPEQYRLFIYLIDEVQGETGDSQDNKIIYNKCLTENGIFIRVK